MAEQGKQQQNGQATQAQQSASAGERGDGNREWQRPARRH